MRRSHIDFEIPAQKARERYLLEPNRETRLNLIESLVNLDRSLHENSLRMADVEKRVLLNLELSRLYGDMGDAVNSARRLYYAGKAFSSMGRKWESYKSDKKACEIFRHLSMNGNRALKTEYMQTLLYLAIAAGEVGRKAEADAADEEGIRLARKMIQKAGERDEGLRHLAMFIRGKGTRLAQEGKDKEAILFFLEAGRYFDRSAQTKNRDKVVNLKELARSYYKIGKVRKALSLINKALAIPQDKGERPSVWLRYHKGKCLWKLGRREKALDVLRDAVREIESRRGEVEYEDNRISYFAQYLSVYDKVIEFCLKAGRVEEAYDFARQCKARVLVENLRGGRRHRTRSMGSLKDIQKNLHWGEALVEYHIGKHESYVFIVRQSSLKYCLIQAGVDHISSEIKSLYGFLNKAGSALSHPALDWQLKRLYELFFLPMEKHLIGVKRIRFVLSRDLALLPFAALIDGKGHRLIKRFEISYLPSAELLGESRRSFIFLKPELKFLAIANPAGDLVHAEQEARKAAKLFKKQKVYSGTEADKGALERHSSAIVHLACHGRFEGGENTYLELSSHGEDGRLTDLEIRALRFDATDLVFLSGCFTGRGKTEIGDEAMGFARSFLETGAKSVIVTLWDVEDAATSRLVQEFYRNLARGKGKAQSLRLAQLKTMQSHPHPYSWAAFQLLGQGR